MVKGRIELGCLWGLLALVLLPGCSSSETVTSPPGDYLASNAWLVGSEVTLVLQTDPVRIGETVSFTVVAPGQGQPANSGLRAEIFGLAGVQLLWLPAEYREQELALAAAAGARYIGLDFDWRKLEPNPDEYDWGDVDQVLSLAKRYGVQLVPMLLFTPRWASTASYAPLDYHRAPPINVDDYRDFVFAVVNRYKPYGSSPITQDGYGITDWVIWNEPNMRTGGAPPSPGEFWIGSLEDYLRLLRAGYEGAHAADPACNVLNGALADVYWLVDDVDLISALERFYDPNGDGDTADGGRPFFDTLNMHTYQAETPEATWYQERLEAVVQLMDRFGDSQKPIWITETGYGSIPGSLAETPFVTEEAQAEAVQLIYESSAAFPQVERVFWWSLRDYYRDASPSNPAMEAHYGLLRADFAPKPAYLAYGRLTGSFDQILTLTEVTDSGGTAQVTIPASFVSRPGNYIVFAGAEQDETSVLIRLVSQVGQGAQN